MGRQKNFFCTNCKTKHPRPINKNCENEVQSVSDQDNELSVSVENTSVNSGTVSSGDSSGMNAMLLSELKNISAKMESMEKRLATTELKLLSAEARCDDSKSAARHKVKKTSVITSTPQETTDDDSSDSELVLPSKKFIKQDTRIQAQIQKRLDELKAINEQDDKGKFKSQRTLNDNVSVKCKIPWPQNQVLSGSTRSRPSYDNLTVFQWVTGFARIAQEESNIEIKNQMLEYLAEIMEDAQDFSWASAKACHAVVLCRMEDGKLSWDDTQNLDRIRRAHAQKVIGNSNHGATGGKFGTAKDTGLICKFFQIGSCNHNRDHISGGRKYRHVCSNCHGSHPAKDCKNTKEKQAKNG